MYLVGMEDGLFPGMMSIMSGDKTEMEEERRLAFVCRHVNAPDYALQNWLSLEDAARRLRYKALFAYAAEAKCDYIVTAHQLMTRQKPF